ncbi:MAG: Uracil-DNA glycosylase, partial [Actinomyces urogenitalis DORA_12]
MSDARPLSELVDPSWAQALAPVEQTIHEIGDRLRQEVAG